ncbi:alpha/beta fold hydrolase [Halobacillus naozhouensis]|uniref:Alpha/beta hydrolase n=1 Tax=Halobacillus naozhouensis TaxID=554880 RepID=A0ABY8J502_9BACI|nr:alpha/beta hydrolase [Halobacillus naozhouensis]WFT76031.1 alpha/beta hydrolase [Halobacillus naozhouensis]
MAATLFDTAKGTVEFSYEGTGPTILLLKGGHCSRDTDLSHRSLMYEGFSLLTISRPGYDLTDVSAGRTATDFAETIVDILDHLHIEKVSVIAISSAGPTGIALAASYPDRVEKLVMEAAVTAPWEFGTKMRANLLFGRGEKATWGTIKLLLKVCPDMVMKKILASLTTEEADDLYSRLSLNDRRFIYNMLADSQSGHGFLLDIKHDLADMSKIQAPILGMYARKDKSVPYSQAILLKSNTQNCEIYDAPADSHLIWIGPEAPNVWAKRLEFLSH